MTASNVDVAVSVALPLEVLTSTGAKFWNSNLTGQLDNNSRPNVTELAVMACHGELVSNRPGPEQAVADVCTSWGFVNFCTSRWAHSKVRASTLATLR